MKTITKEFLEAALGKKISTFEVNPGSNPGDNYSSLLYSIDITLAACLEDKQDSAQGPVLHLLLKCYPLNPASQEYLSSMNIFQRELSMYNSLIPELIRFQSAVPNGGKFVKPPFPNFIYGRAVDYQKMAPDSKLCLDSLENCILMPDLRKTGNFRLANRFVGFDLDHAQLVVEALAKFHSLSWSYKVTSGLTCLSDRFPLLGDASFENFDNKVLGVMMDNSVTLFKAAVRSRVKDDMEKVTLMEGIDRMRSKALDLCDIYFNNGHKVTDPSLTRDNVLRIAGPIREDEKPWIVANHGDCWLNNMMFRYDEGAGKPVEVALIDLQVTAEGDPLADLCYCIYTSTTPALRKAHISELLKLYADTLTAICGQFNVDPPAGFDLKELARRFHRGKAFGFACCLMCFPTFMNEAKDVVDMEGEKKGDSEGGFFEEISKMSQGLKGNPRFETRVVDLLRELYSEGVI